MASTIVVLAVWIVTANRLNLHKSKRTVPNDLLRSNGCNESEGEAFAGCKVVLPGWVAKCICAIF